MPPQAVPCKACGKPVPIDTDSLEKGRAYCPTCHAGFFILELWPPERAAALRKDFLEYSIPDGWGIASSGGVLRKGGPWRSAEALWFLGVCAVLAGAGALWLNSRAGFFAALLAAAAAGFLYGMLLVWFNRSELRAGKGHLRIYSGPLPPRTGIDVPAEQAGRVFWRVRIPPGGCGTFARGSVFLSREGGAEPVLTDLGISQIETAAAMLEGHLGPQADAWPGPAEADDGPAPAPKPTLWGAALLIGLTAALALAASKGRDVALFAVVGTYVILLHEGGHWLAALACGIPVRRFMVGLGPGVFSFVFMGTRFEFRAIPLLGFVEPGLRKSPQGEPDAGAMVPASELAPLRARSIFILAGAAANLLAAASHLWLYYRLDPMAAAVPAPILGPVRPGSAADEAGLREGDRVLSIAGRSPAEPWGRDVRVLLDAARRRTPVDLEVSRGSRRDHVSWLPRGITAKERLDDSEIYGLGLAPTETWRIAAVAPSTGNFLRAGDEVVSVAFGGERFSHPAGDSTQAVDWLFEQAAGRPVDITVRREGRTRTFAVSPLIQEDDPLLCLRHEPRLRWVRRDSPAWTAGLRPGDLVLSIAGAPVEDDRQLRGRLYAAARRPLALELDRGGQRVRAVLLPEPFKSGRDRGIPEGRWTEFGRDGLRVSSVTAALAARLPDLAVGDVRSAPGYRRGRLCWFKPDGRELCADYGKVSDLAVKKTIYNPPFRFDIVLEPRPRGALDSLGDALGICRGMLRNVGGLLRAMFQDAGSLSGAKDPGAVTGEMRESPARLLFFVAMISCIVAVLNLLPVPPLDGFRLLETLWQSVFGRTPHFRAVRHPSCLGCLGALVLAVLLGAGMFSFLRDLWLAVWR